jgi:hypothetical protein
MGYFMGIKKWKYKEKTWFRHWDELLCKWDENDFLEWLENECQNKWEVISISRDESSKSKSTWCVFRKMK